MAEKEPKQRTAFFDALLGTMLIFFGLVIYSFSPRFATSVLGSGAINSDVFFGMLIIGALMVIVGISLLMISTGKGLTRSL